MLMMVMMVVVMLWYPSVLVVAIIIAITMAVIKAIQTAKIMAIIIAIMAFSWLCGYSLMVELSHPYTIHLSPHSDQKKDSLNVN